jgi:hypothetical protein
MDYAKYVEQVTVESLGDETEAGSQRRLPKIVIMTECEVPDETVNCTETSYRNS